MADIRKSLRYPEDCASIRDEIRELTTCIRDHGTSSDGGGGMGKADLWLTVDGIEYFITVTRSLRQQQLDAQAQYG